MLAAGAHDRSRSGGNRAHRRLLRAAPPWALLLVSVTFGASSCERQPPQSPQSGSETEPTATATAPSQPVPADRAASVDAPEISRSVGVEGGIVVLWPRVVGPRGSPTRAVDQARQLQSRLVAIAGRVAPGRPVDVRPQPERVCPRSGCSALALGVVLAVSGQGCAAIALVSDPGQSPAELVPWGGQVRLKSNSVPFREPPELAVRITDYARCDSLLEALNDKSVEAAIQRRQR
jgi:hypothetical protein